VAKPNLDAYQRKARIHQVKLSNRKQVRSDRGMEHIDFVQKGLVTPQKIISNLKSLLSDDDVNYEPLKERVSINNSGDKVSVIVPRSNRLRHLVPAD